jgi:uncharacterized YigZ family protein
MPRKLIPAQETSSEIRVANSRFIATIAPAFTIEEARDFIKKIRVKYQDASHNVPAFIVGHGASVTEHCSDDGEPEGTAGRPVLAVLKGSDLGDAAIVVTRYFGGTKLGTGGLVRAYSDATRTVLKNLSLAEKISTHTIEIETPYNLFEMVLRRIEENHGQILNKDFAAKVTLTIRFTQSDYPIFKTALTELSRGKINPTIITSDENSIFPISK